jgi:hypothetical protein
MLGRHEGMRGRHVSVRSPLERRIKRTVAACLILVPAGTVFGYTSMTVALGAERVVTTESHVMSLVISIRVFLLCLYMKLVVTQLLKKLLVFMEPGPSSMC